MIPRSVRIAEAPSFGVPVSEHAPASRGSEAYDELARELAEREEADWVTIERLEPSGEEDADSEHEAEAA